MLTTEGMQPKKYLKAEDMTGHGTEYLVNTENCVIAVYFNGLPVLVRPS